MSKSLLSPTVRSQTDLQLKSPPPMGMAISTMVQMIKDPASSRQQLKKLNVIGNMHMYVLQGLTDNIK